MKTLSWNHLKMPGKEERLFELYHENSKIIDPSGNWTVVEKNIDDLPTYSPFLMNYEEEIQVSESNPGWTFVILNELNLAHNANPSNPVEIYSISNRVQPAKSKTGVYHFVPLLGILGNTGTVEKPLNTGYETLLLLTVLLNKNRKIYGERGYRTSLFQCGEIAGKIIKSLKRLQISCDVIHDVNERKAEEILGIDGIGHVYITALGLRFP